MIDEDRLKEIEDGVSDWVVDELIAEVRRLQRDYEVSSSTAIGLTAEVRRLKAQLEEFGTCDGCGAVYTEPEHTPSCPNRRRA